MSAIVRVVQMAVIHEMWFSAWEPSRSVTNPAAHDHACTTSDEAHGRIGDVPSRLGTDLAYEQLPIGSMERIGEMKARRERLNAEAYAAILDAFPWLADCGNRDDGRIWCLLEDYEENTH